MEETMRLFREEHGLVRHPPAAIVLLVLVGLIAIFFLSRAGSDDFSAAYVAAGRIPNFEEEIEVLNPVGCRPPEPTLNRVEILGAKWCPYCRDLRERVLGTEGVLEEYCSQVLFVEVNIDPGDPEKNYDGDKRDFYRVGEEGIPEIHFFKGQKEIMPRHSGVVEPDPLRGILHWMVQQ